MILSWRDTLSGYFDLTKARTAKGKRNADKGEKRPAKWKGERPEYGKEKHKFKREGQQAMKKKNKAYVRAAGEEHQRGKQEWPEKERKIHDKGNLAKRLHDNGKGNLA